MAYLTMVYNMDDNFVERRTMADRRKHPDGSDCPLNHESVDKLLSTLDSIDGRLKKIEKFMLIGHVVVWTIGIMAGAFWWFFEHVEHIRDAMKDFIGNNNDPK